MTVFNTELGKTVRRQPVDLLKELLIETICRNRFKIDLLSSL